MIIFINVKEYKENTRRKQTELRAQKQGAFTRGQDRLRTDRDRRANSQYIYNIYIL